MTDDDGQAAEIAAAALQPAAVLGADTWLSAMALSPREVEKLVIYQVAELARRRRQRGTKLNVPEAIALICETVLESARDGASLADTIEAGKRVVTRDDVLPGVPEMVPFVQVEAIFATGTQLISVGNPIEGHNGEQEEGRKDNLMIPGEWLVDDGSVEINAGRPVTRLLVRHTGDRPIQIGSHYHFFEVNAALRFDRRGALGKRLDIPSGQAIRFEPGEAREVDLVEFGGTGRITGFNRMTEGIAGGRHVAARALRRAAELGYLDDEDDDPR